MTQVQELIANATKKYKEGSIVKGRILEVRPREFLVDIGYKSEGTIPAIEFDDPADVAVQGHAACGRAEHRRRVHDGD